MRICTLRIYTLAAFVEALLLFNGGSTSSYSALPKSGTDPGKPGMTEHDIIRQDIISLIPHIPSFQ